MGACEYERVWDASAGAYLMTGGNEVAMILACDLEVMAYHGFRVRDRVRVERVRETVVSELRKEYKHGFDGSMREREISREVVILGACEYRLTKKSGAYMWVEV